MTYPIARSLTDLDASWRQVAVSKNPFGFWKWSISLPDREALVRMRDDGALTTVHAVANGTTRLLAALLPERAAERAMAERPRRGRVSSLRD